MAWLKAVRTKDKAAGDEATAADWAQPILLNAGGILYSTSRGSLRHLSEHSVFGPVVRGTAPRFTEDGSFFIDCDGYLFRYILNYLRKGGGSGGTAPASAADVATAEGKKEPIPPQSSRHHSLHPADPRGDPVASAPAALCLPENFDEWEQLLCEARKLKLDDLEACIVTRYEYQRMLFTRTLPLGVCVRWPTTVIVREGASHTSALLPPQQQQQQQHVPSPTATPSATPSAPSAAGGAQALSTPTSSGVILAEQLARSALQVSITPSLPSLSVAEDGRTVWYGPPGSQTVVADLDRLVLLLVSAYGYTIDHWQEREGRVFLTLRNAH